MRLIKLDIVGFKSFQEKTSLVFPRGITAVVGPNGCGKSNIVDALRWVMGEQSVKQLRGKSLEDLIFAGADGKQPLNMAEVSLTIENSGGDVPESAMNAYTEIMVTRRIFRSGESVYMINRQPCRLKDIHSLFLGSGSGKNSFAVIQQGNIGALTEASPEERRFFIEDAADITKFKERKKETLSRIKSTEENLVRLSDIVAELKRQITNLDRQASKAKKFKEYRSLARNLDIRIALWYFDRYSRDIKDKQQTIANLKDSDHRRSEQLIELEARLSTIDREAMQQKQQIEDLDHERFELQRAVDKKENDREHLNREISRLTEEIQTEEDRFKELEQKNRGLSQEIEQARNSHVDIDDDLDRSQAELTSERERRDQLKSRLQDLEQTLKTHHREHMVLAGNEAKAHSVLDHARQRKEDLDRRLRRIDEDILDSERRLGETRAEKSRAQLTMENIQLVIRDLSTDRCRIRETLARLTERCDDQRKTLRHLDMDHSAHVSRHSTLKKIQEHYGWYKQGVKAVMQHVSSEHDTRVLGLVAERLRPRPGYEAAAEAVMGESLQYILVDTPKAATDLIAFLRESQRGHGGFVPRTMLAPPAPRSVPQGFTALIDQVEFDEQDRALAETLLQNAWVVPNLEAGLTHPDAGFRVTREGDLITDKGLLLGGSKDPTASIFGKKQEITDLKAAIDGIEARQTALKKDLENLDAEINRLRDREKELIDELSEREDEKQDGEKTLLLCVEALKQVEKRRDILALEKEQLTGEDEDIDQEIMDLAARLQTIRDDIRVIEGQLEDAGTQTSQVTAQFDTHSKTVVELQLKITTLTARRDNHHNALKRLEEFLNEGLKRTRQLDQDISEKKDRSARISRTLASDHIELEHLSRNLARVSEEERLARRTLSTIEKSHKEQEKIKADVLKERDRDTSQQQAFEIELSQLRLKRESLTCRIEEKYHHRINQYSLEFEEQEMDVTGLSSFDITGMESDLKDLNRKISQLGDVNLSAISEFEELKTRYDFLIEQQNDLVQSLSDLETIIAKINRVSQERFLETFNLINDKLGDLFPTLFEGGSARMTLTDPASPLTTGVELMIQPPGKKLTRLSLLSGGEKALSAIAFVFSIFLIKPSSFCIMDEIDAPLDDANVMRFNNLVKHIGTQSQILMITHNKLSMEFADVLFGVTMEKKGVSKIVSVNLSGLPDPESGQNQIAVA